VCEPCILGEHHTKSFPVSCRDATYKLELVQLVCGPISERSLGGTRFVATTLDDYTKLSLAAPVASRMLLLDLVGMC
jgi:hypothetical protein